MRAIDLFAGAGGFSFGAHMAGVQTVWAGNHWDLACEAFERNHGIEPKCQDLQQADWRLVPEHDVMLASPACQGHSRAKGKERPHHDALRSTAWAIVSAAECHRPPFVVVENVPEFQGWALFGAWSAAMQALGYALAPMVLDAADHGVPQHRRRLFVVCTRSRSPIQLRLPRRPHVGAERVIDFAAGRWSAVHRPGRSANTLARVEAGRRQFGSRFVMPYYGSGSGLTGRDLGRPLGTVTTRARWAVVDGDRMRMVLAAEGRAFMGMPTNFWLPKNEALAWHLLGNAVAPAVAADILTELRRAA